MAERLGRDKLLEGLIERMDVVNLVATTKLELADITLESLRDVLSHYGEAEYDRAKFPGLIFKPRPGRSILLFSSGSVVIAGARSQEEIRELVVELVRYLKPYLRSKSITVKIENVVIYGRLRAEIDIERAAELVDSIYNPEVFPGLIVRPRAGSPTVLLFTNGSFVVVGSRGEDEARRALLDVVRVLHREGALIPETGLAESTK